MKQEDRQALSRLAQSGEAQRLIQLLSQKGSVRQAAQEAAGGKPEALIASVRQLMESEEGARLVEQISRQAKRSGLTE